MAAATAAAGRREEQEEMVLRCLLEAFPSVPLEEVVSAFVEVGGDPNKTADILFAGEGKLGPGQGCRYPVKAAAAAMEARPPPPPLMSWKECVVRNPPKAATSPPLRRVSPPKPTQQAPAAKEEEATGGASRFEMEFPPLRRNPRFATDDRKSRSLVRPPVPDQARCRYAGSSSASSSSSSPPSLSSPFSSSSSSSWSDGSLEDFGDKDSAQIVADCTKYATEEEFLLSILDFGSEMDTCFVRDVVGHFQGDLSKSLDTLFNMLIPTITYNFCGTGQDNDMFSLPNSDTFMGYSASLISYIDNKADGQVSLSNLDAFIELEIQNRSSNEKLLYSLIEAFPEHEPHEVIKAFQVDGQVSLSNLDAFIELEIQNRSSNEKLMYSLIEAFPEHEPHEVIKAFQDSYHDFEQVVDYFLGMEECKQFDNFFQSKLNQSNANLKEILKSAKRIEHTKLSNSILQSLFRWEQLMESNASLERTFDDMNKSKGIKGEIGDSIVCTNNKMESGLKRYNGKWEDYNYHRENANFLWRTMKRYFQEATIAYSRKEGARACLLAKEGKVFKILATRASRRASNILFQLQTVCSENNITIDLHSQYVEEAVNLLNLHLKSLTSFPSVDTLTIITGIGNHSVGGYPRLKVAVTRYLERKGIGWIEPNPGCFVIKLKSLKCG